MRIYPTIKTNHYLQHIKSKDTMEKKTTRESPEKNTIQKVKKVACWNCGGNHTVKECKYPLNKERIQKNKKLFLSKRQSPYERRKILFEIYKELENEASDESSGNASESEGDSDQEINPESNFMEVHGFEENSDIEDDLVEICFEWGNKNSDSDYFYGGCLDVGDQKSVVGLQLVKEYCKQTGQNMRKKINSKISYKFGDHVCIIVLSHGD